VALTQHARRIADLGAQGSLGTPPLKRTKRVDMTLAK
jgi:hypothetical protein